MNKQDERRAHIKDLVYRFQENYAEYIRPGSEYMALSFITVLCLLAYRLAEHLLRRQLISTSQTVPNQFNNPTDRPTMR